MTLSGDGTASQLLDAQIELWNGAGTSQIALDSNGSLVSFAFTPNASGTYYVSAAGDDSSDVGTFDLSVRTEIVDSIETLASISPDTTVAGNIDFGGDDDWYRIELSTEYNYIFTLSGDGTSGQLVDTEIELFNGAGTNQLANAYNGVSSSFFYTPSASGVYYVSAAGDDSSDIGSYKLTVATEVASTVDTAASVSPGDIVESQIDYGDDDDWYRIEMVAGEEYTFTLDGDGTSSQINEYRLDLRNGSGNILVTRTEDDGSPAVLVYTPAASGTYFIDVASDSGSETGGYILSVAGPSDPIEGTNKDDTLNGGASDDTIIGKNGSDSISGYDGDDTIEGGQGRDTIDGGSGADSISGKSGDDLLLGGIGNRSSTEPPRN